MAPLDMKPNELEPYWIPFTANRAFKKRPRLFAGAKGMHYFKPDGAKVIDATSGLFCVNAGHGREPIVTAIQEAAARLDFAPPFQYGHPQLFELSSRLTLLAPGDLDYVLFANSGSEAVDTALKVALAYHRSRGEGSRTRFIGRERGYHGVGFGGISVGGMVANRRTFGNMLAGVDHLSTTYNRDKQAFSVGEPEWGAELADELTRLINLGVMPYYLHQLDRVAGAAHFEVPIETGRALVAAMRRALPGYAVPRYVQEVPGETAKTVLM